MMSSDAQVADTQRKLDAFLVDNPELETLNARLGTFNLFNVLRIENAEIRHSNVLAWLLTPGQTHGLGDLFLRRFLSRLLMENDEIDVSLTPAEAELMDLSDVEVFREWKNIDILVSSQTGNWCLLIENKIRAKESRGQLEKYFKDAKHEKPSHEIIPVFLTLEGDDPSVAAQEAGYIALSHVQVLETAQRVVDQNKARIPRDASTFLEHYLSVLPRLTMQDEELVDLCKTIYRKHREAIDLIVEYGATSQVTGTCEDEIASYVDCEFVKTAGKRIWFVPREMGKLEPTVALSQWRFLPRHVPVVRWYYYHQKSGKLLIVMEVGPVTNGALRKRLLKAIQKAGFSFSEKNAFRDDAMLTRIVSKRQKLRIDENGEPDHDPEYIKDVTRVLWKKLWDEGSKIMTVLEKFDWKAAD